MADTAKHTAGQWPDNIVSGDIRYARADNYDGFYLADASHGIPTFASVTETGTPTIRGQHVRVFNYPGQTEAIAAELVHRWNAHIDLLVYLKNLLEAYSKPDERLCCDGRDCGCRGSTAYQMAEHYARAAIAKAEARS